VLAVVTTPDRASGLELTQVAALVDQAGGLWSCHETKGVV
jgi:hypothetical protein